VAAFNLLSSSPQSTRDLATKLALPTKTVRRTLEDLMCQHLAIRHRDLDEFGDEKLSGADLWEIQYPSP
jgi:predicted ArsR family transcriptional regulator